MTMTTGISLVLKKAAWPRRPVRRSFYPNFDRGFSFQQQEQNFATIRARPSPEQSFFYPYSPATSSSRGFSTTSWSIVKDERSDAEGQSRETHGRRQRHAPDLPSPIPGRLMTLSERFQRFPEAVWELVLDAVLCSHIQDASRTPRNAWTNNKPLLRPANKQNHHHSVIPWRQQRHLRQTESDWALMTPLVVLWIPPIIGFLPIILAATAPRQVLSRQFQNEFERYEFARLEYEQRAAHFSNVRNQLWNFFVLNQRVQKTKFVGRDASSSEELWFNEYTPRTLRHRSTVDEFLSMWVPILETDDWDLANLPRSYLAELTLAVGIFQSFPPWISTRIVQGVVLAPILRSLLEHLMSQLLEDDELLLREVYGYSSIEEFHYPKQVFLRHRLETLTDAEVVEACRMRGLPVNIGYIEMRENLMDYLEIAFRLNKKLYDGINMDENHGERALQLTPTQHGMFMMHLAILRQYDGEE